MSMFLKPVSLQHRNVSPFLSFIQFSRRNTWGWNENVVFHDGSPLDTQDVKFSLDRARSEDSTNAQKALFEGITSIKILSPTKIEINLSEPNGNFIKPDCIF